MNYWLTIAAKFDNFNKLAAILARWSVILMLGIGFWNVIGRYVGANIGSNLSSNLLIEAQWYLFDAIFLLGMGWTLQNKNHVSVDILQNRIGLQTQRKLLLLGTLFLLIPFALGVTAISINPMVQSWTIGEVSPDPNGLPRYLIKSLIPIGFFLLTLQGISDVIRLINQLKESSDIKVKKLLNKSGEDS